MEKSVDYLKAAIEKLGAKSDTKAAQSLEISKQAISQYLNESRVMDDFAAAKVAEALGIHPWEVITLCNAEREKTEERRAFWRGFRSEVAGIRTQIGHATIKAMIVTALATSFLIGAASVAVNNGGYVEKIAWGSQEYWCSMGFPRREILTHDYTFDLSVRRLRSQSLHLREPNGFAIVCCS